MPARALRHLFEIRSILILQHSVAFAGLGDPGFSFDTRNMITTEERGRMNDTEVTERFISKFKAAVTAKANLCRYACTPGWMHTQMLHEDRSSLSNKCHQLHACTNDVRPSRVAVCAK